MGDVIYVNFATREYITGLAILDEELFSSRSYQKKHPARERFRVSGAWGLNEPEMHINPPRYRWFRKATR
jgi:hypothetical protein